MVGIIIPHHHKDIHVLILETCEYLKCQRELCLGRMKKSIQSHKEILEKIKHVISALLQLLRQNPDWRWDHSGKMCGGDSGLIQFIPKSYSGFLRVLYEEKHCQLGLKKGERTK